MVCKMDKTRSRLDLFTRIHHDDNILILAHIWILYSVIKKVGPEKYVDH